MTNTNYTSVHPPITADTDAKTIEAIKAVADAARATLDSVPQRRMALDGPRPPKASVKKRARLRVRASRRANR